MLGFGRKLFNRKVFVILISTLFFFRSSIRQAEAQDFAQDGQKGEDGKSPQNQNNPENGKVLDQDSKSEDKTKIPPSDLATPGPPHILKDDKNKEDRQPQSQPKKKKKVKQVEEGEEDVPQEWWDSGAGEEDGSNF